MKQLTTKTHTHSYDHAYAYNDEGSFVLCGELGSFGSKEK